MRKIAAIAIMLSLLGGLIAGCDRQLMIELGLLPPDPVAEDATSSEDGEVTSETVPDQNVAAPTPAEDPPVHADPPPAQSPASLHDFVPADVLCVARLCPHRSVLNPLVAQLPIRQTLIEMGRTDMGVDLRAPGIFLHTAGAFLDDLEEIVLIVDGLRIGRAAPTAALESPQTVGEDDPAYCGNIADGYILRFRGNAPRTAAKQMLFRPQRVSYEGVQYFGRGRDTSWGATYFPDEHTIILGEETLVRKMIRAQVFPETRLAGLESIGSDYDLTIRLDWQAVWRRLPLQWKQDPRGRLLADTLSTARLSMRISERPTVGVRLEAKSAAAARSLEQFVRQRLDDFRAETFDDPLPGPWEVVRRDIGRRAGQDLRVERIGDRLELSLVDSFGLDDLLAALRRWAAAAHGETIADDPPPAVEPPIDDPSTPEPSNPSLGPGAVAAAAAIRQQLPTASGIRLSEYLAFVQGDGGFSPRDFSEQTLTVGLLCTWKYDDDVEAMYPDRLREFRFTTPGPPDPPKVATVMSRSSWLGYCTMLQAETVTSLSCDVAGETASGVVTFDAPGLFAGSIGYKARRDADDLWRITSFEMPGHAWRFVRDEAGRWCWYDAFGDVSNRDRCPAKRPIIGRVTLDARPLAAGRLEFFHEHFPEWPFDDFLLRAAISDGGLFSIDVPPGRYFVRVGPDDAAIPERYKRLDTSGLQMNVDKTTRVVDFDLASE